MDWGIFGSVVAAGAAVFAPCILFLWWYTNKHATDIDGDIIKLEAETKQMRNEYLDLLKLLPDIKSDIGVMTTQLSTLASKLDLAALDKKVDANNNDASRNYDEMKREFSSMKSDLAKIANRIP